MPFATTHENRKALILSIISENPGLIPAGSTSDKEAEDLAQYPITAQIFGFFNAKHYYRRALSSTIYEAIKSTLKSSQTYLTDESFMTEENLEGYFDQLYCLFSVLISRDESLPYLVNLVKRPVGEYLIFLFMYAPSFCSSRKELPRSVQALIFPTDPINGPALGGEILRSFFKKVDFILSLSESFYLSPEEIDWVVKATNFSRYKLYYEQDIILALKKLYRFNEVNFGYIFRTRLPDMVAGFINLFRDASPERMEELIRHINQIDGVECTLFEDNSDFSFSDDDQTALFCEYARKLSISDLSTLKHVMMALKQRGVVKKDDQVSILDAFINFSEGKYYFYVILVDFLNLEARPVEEFLISAAMLCEQAQEKKLPAADLSILRHVMNTLHLYQVQKEKRAMTLDVFRASVGDKIYLHDNLLNFFKVWQRCRPTEEMPLKEFLYVASTYNRGNPIIVLGSLRKFYYAPLIFLHFADKAEIDALVLFTDNEKWRPANFDYLSQFIKNLLSLHESLSHLQGEQLSLPYGTVEKAKEQIPDLLMHLFDHVYKAGAEYDDLNLSVEELQKLVSFFKEMLEHQASPKQVFSVYMVLSSSLVMPDPTAEDDLSQHPKIQLAILYDRFISQHIQASTSEKLTQAEKNFLQDINFPEDILDAWGGIGQEEKRLRRDACAWKTNSSNPETSALSVNAASLSFSSSSTQPQSPASGPK